MTSRFINLHLLQPFSFANPNRDDVGAPKTLFYGGKQRSRISSQSWKRAVRIDAESRLDSDSQQKTYRASPKHLAAPIADRMMELLGDDADDGACWKAGFCATQLLSTKAKNIKFNKIHEAWLQASGRTADDETSSNNEGTKDQKEDAGSTLVWLTDTEVGALATELVSKWPDIGVECSKTKGGSAPTKIGKLVAKMELAPHAITVAAFGRMFANSHSNNVEAAVQVAHAFTTHESVQQVDYFTAVDDLSTSQGAGHLNLAQFTGGVYYRYLSYDLAQLEANLGRQEADWLRALLLSSIHALPSGKQNSTANHEAPSLVLAELRDRPLSYAGAFEVPVATTSATDHSVRALLDHAVLVDSMLGSTAVNRALATIVPDPQPLPEGTVCVPSVDDVISAVSPWS